MAVRSFATNNLVKEHDMYVKYMNARKTHFKEHNANDNDILFCYRGLVAEVFDISAEKLGRTKYTADMLYTTKAIRKWHSITIAYNLWCDYAKFYIDRDHSSIQYKKFVDIPEDILKKIKFRFEQSVRHAGCVFSTNKKRDRVVDPCRLLAMYWTYLDIMKDTKTQRYFPNNATCDRAVKVFGYKKGDNPFALNGGFSKVAIRDKEGPMDKLVEACDEKTKAKVADISDMLIEDMEFSYRTYNAIKRHQINRLGDILDKTISDLMHIRNFGMASLKEIIKKLEEYGYTYPKDDHDNYIWNRKPYYIDKKNSVIDIAEQAAKEVEEEKPSIAEQLQDKYNILCVSHEKLSGKYEALLKTAQEQADNYDKLLREKLELEGLNFRLKDEISDLRDKYDTAVAVNNKLKESSSTDIVAIISHVVDIMKKHGITKLETGIGGYSIDIIQKFVIGGRN